MNDFAWYFDNFTAHMVEYVSKHYKLTNMEYQEIESYLHRYENRYNLIIESLDENDRKFMREYIRKQLYEISCVTDCLYLEGYKDCVKLLNNIGVI
ncbi:hypothetical protein SH1V18_34710 [Vallitalea longa]|uniref:Uncharacterized protein n=1 Tax=Vallitalea longa TaxID=2936439 RepID=A0A9W6DF93_9FIRM|nr:hypothetical protein [Vallitalea longa]GKX30991.1 hypothetical protein SH1V18_34710 [Vallitalea longa]